MASPSENGRTTGGPRLPRSSGINDPSTPMPRPPDDIVWPPIPPKPRILHQRPRPRFPSPERLLSMVGETSNVFAPFSSPLPSTLETEPSIQSMWHSTMPNPSGNSSPSRQRTNPVTGDVPFFSQPPASQAAIGSRGPAGAISSQTLRALDEPSQNSNHPNASNAFPLRSNGGGFLGSWSSQFPVVTNPPAQLSKPETNGISGGQQLGEARYGPYSSHFQRPSVSGVDQGHRGTGSASGFHLEEDDLSTHMNGMSFDNDTGFSSGRMTGQGFQPSQPSQLNPSSQPWNDAGPFMPDINDMYGAGGRPRHGLGRASPAEFAFHNQRSFPGTPQPSPDIWGRSRPASRDHRNPADSGRALIQPYLQAQPHPHHSVSHGNPQLYHAYPSPYDNFAMPAPRSGYLAPASRQSGGEVVDPVLREYRGSLKSGRSDRHRQWELRDVFGHVVAFCGDQQGSRFIQDKLRTANSDEKQTVCDEILPEFVVLAKDVFGNYVVQKMFQHGTQAQKRMLADKMRGQVVSMSLSSYGCRVVQDALDHILTEQVAGVSRELEPEILKIMRDTHGNHVVQKVIQVAPREHIGFIFDSLKGRVGELSQHNYACRVVQRALEAGTEEDRKTIVKEIHDSIAGLVPDQYGNYVAQHVIEKGNAEDRSLIIEYVTKGLINHSRHKYASNVVEKCIVHGTDKERRLIVEKLVGTPGVDDVQLQGVMKDSYGNYVVQQLLKTLKGPDLAALKDTLKPHFVVIKKPTVNTNTMKHINQLESLVCSPTTTPASPTPASPGLQGNGVSTVATPNLTTEPNSPSSNPPPSTEASSVGDEELNGSVAVRARC